MRSADWLSALWVVVSLGGCPSPGEQPRSCLGDGIHAFTTQVRFSGQRANIDAQIWISPECIQAEALVDGTSLGMTRDGGVVRIDSTKLPDGQHDFLLRADTWAEGEHQSFLTDNTPPFVTTCHPRSTAWGQLSRRAGIDVTFSEPVCWYWDPLVCRRLTSVNLVPPLPTPLSLPGHIDLDWSQWTDEALNPFGPPLCGAEYDAWLLPWGEGSIPALAGSARTVLAASLAVDPADGPLAEILRLEAGPGGRLQYLSGVPPDDFAPGDLIEYSPLSQVLQLVGRNFIEQEPDGSTWLRSWSANGITTVIGLDPTRRPVLQRTSSRTAAWIEDGPSDHRVFSEALDLSGQGDWWISRALVRPGADVLEAFAYYDATTNTVAVIDAVPGSPAQFRLMGLTDTGDWIDAFGSLNRDPEIDASQPTFSFSGGLAVMAWVEGGEVLARQHNVRVVGGGMTGPMVLNADSGHPARSPRAFQPYDRVLFVEQWPDGDRIEFRQPHPYLPKFEIYPSIETGGEVSELETDKDFSLTVLWTEATGEVRIRAFNE